MTDSVVSNTPVKFVRIRAFAWSFIASVPAVLLELARQDWFGAGDLSQFLVFTAIFALIISLFAQLVYRALCRLPIVLRYGIGGFLGLLFAAAFTLCNAIYLGPWFGAWSFSVFVAWLVGGLLGFAAAAGTRAGATASQHTTEALLFAGLLLLLVTGIPIAVQAVTQDQALTLVYAIWQPDDTALEIHDLRGHFNPQDIELLNRASIQGRVEVYGTSTITTVERPLARVVILLQGPVHQTFRLAQPYASHALYYQAGTAIDRYPEQGNYLDRAIELSPEKERPWVTKYWVEHASGSRSGGDLYHWTIEE